MRTTLRLDDDVYSAARSLARHEGKSVGDIVSELIRKALAPPPPPKRRRGQGSFPTFDLPRKAAPITAEMVKQALDEP
jgi:hypothetical protein